jgi:hypothetical protein
VDGLFVLAQDGFRDHRQGECGEDGEKGQGADHGGSPGVFFILVSVALMSVNVLIQKRKTRRLGGF